MPKSKKSGLPDSMTMRHDRHFVELISKESFGPQVRMIPINKIMPNPQQARNELGDLTDLIQSIKDYNQRITVFEAVNEEVSKPDSKIAEQAKNKLLTLIPPL